MPTEWSAAVDVWLEASSLHRRTRRNYRHHLAAAGSALGRSLAELAPADLAAYRAALLADGRALGTHLCVLLFYPPRSAIYLRAVFTRLL